MRVVIIGAGAVGQTYGWMLAKAGCKVTFMVREKYVEQMAAGVWVYPDEKGPERFTDYALTTVPVETDQVWFCVSSSALPQVHLDWDGALGVYLTPGLHDATLMAEHFEAANLVRGVIPFIAFQAPLPGETREHEGIAWWFPPFMRLPFSGPRANEVSRLLPKAHMTASVDDSVHRVSASMLPTIAALEIGGWSMRGMDKALAARGMKEATAVASAVHDLGNLMTPPGAALGVFASLSPLLVPFDLEVYLKVHFSKVGDQTRKSLAEWVNEGESRGLPVDTLKEMLGRLG